ncbi:glycopeptide antibiotics resistance protein [Paenibacillus qinlingensis]|uniref:Glycopeptide antibiotics resistance protein n=2 Tax=Paenibacillus qinlingensis TaxID=1837343 RepID=A0ABU1NS18_9BACL|nr:glycopeptide antibiotics resistance protein [Paenibacillus qinlingensis]
MGVTDIPYMLMRWAVPALWFVAACIVVFLVSYTLIYQKLLHGVKKISWIKFSLAVLLLGYLFMVFSLTILNRGTSADKEINLNLTSSYLDVWNTWSNTSFLLLVYNIAMLFPLGILLPLVSPKFQSLKAILCISLSFTLGIETFQWITHRGIFELDDLVHNTLGALAGYLIMNAILDITYAKQINKRSLLSAAIIPLFFVCLFGGARVVYHAQEFGNMGIRPAIGTNMSNVTVSSQITLSPNSSMLPIYYDENANQPELALKIISKLQHSIPLPLVQSSGRDGDNLQYSFGKTKDSAYYLNYFLRTGTWTMYDDIADHNQKRTDETTGHNVEQILKDNAFIPSDADLKLDPNGTFRWDAPSVEPSTLSKDFSHGVVMVDVESSGQISSLMYGVFKNKYIRQVQVIAPAAALEKIKKGEFDSYNTRTPFTPGTQIKITEMNIIYLYDSKGYYQPVYQFEGSVNDEVGKFSVSIPALA